MRRYAALTLAVPTYSHGIIQSKAAQPGFNCFAGIIQDDHVADWLNQRGSFALRKNNLYRKVTGGIRILVCEQRGSDPLNFPISRESYLRMEKDFRLSPATLPYFKNSSYNHAWQRNTSEGRNDLGKFRLVLSSLQSMHASLAVSANFA